jgi:hypothetical protein
MPYSEHRREWFRQWHKKRQEQGRCIYCGKPREGEGATAQACPRCAARKRANLDRYRRKKRAGTNYDELLKRHGAPLLIGPAAGKIGVVKTLSVKLDFAAFAALREIHQGYREKQRVLGRPVEPFQLSRLLREAFSRYRNRVIPPRPREGFMTYQVGISLDAATLAIIRHQAESHGHHSLARAVRALLIASRPKRIGATAFRPPPDP